MLCRNLIPVAVGIGGWYLALVAESEGGRRATFSQVKVRIADLG